MANFNTHLFVASTCSGVASGTLLVAGLAQPNEALLYFILGSVGGILPDMDSDNALIIKLIFNFLAVYCSFLIVFVLIGRFSLAELLLIWLLAFLSVAYGVAGIFRKWTVHRGLFHSFPAAILGAASTVALAFHFFHLTQITAWFAGIFLWLGFLSHLILDELYSVDLTNRRIKKSLGSALKLADSKNPLGSLLLYALVIGVLWMGPSPVEFWLEVQQKIGNTHLTMRLLPHGKWFEISAGDSLKDPQR